MFNTFGKYFTFTSWGESHGKAMGVVVDGVPSNIKLNEEDIQPFLDERKPGRMNFTSKRLEEDRVEILSGVFDTSYLEDCSPELIDLIKKLLNVDPTKRLGAQNIHEIMDHPWFKGLDWDHIDQLEPVFVPEQKDKFNVSYFTERYTFQKTDDIEKDILDDIEKAKTRTPQSVSMTDLSAQTSFTQRSNTEEDAKDETDSAKDGSDDMMMFPSIALKNLSKRSFAVPQIPNHRRSCSVSRPDAIALMTPSYESEPSITILKPPADKRKTSTPPPITVPN